MSSTGNINTKLYLLVIPIVIALVHRYLLPIPQFHQWVFFIVSILLTGIPHGSLDHLVARYTRSLGLKKFSSWRFYLSYVSRMAVFGVFWYFFPIASLLIFIAISAFHFGETDLAIDQPRLDPVIILFQTSYGLMLILALLLTHKEDTIAVLSFLEKGSEIQFAKLIHNPALSLTATLGTASVLFLSTLWYCFKYRPTLSWYKTIALQTVLLAFILIFLPFPLAFAFYFGCWHSIQSLVNIRTFLGIALKRKLTWSWVIIKVMPFSLVAFFGIAVLALLVSYTSDIHTYTMLMFIGISILTAPHLEVMSEMYAQLRK